MVEIAETVCGGRILFIMEADFSLKEKQECGLCMMHGLCDIPSLNGKQLTKIKESNPSRFSVLKKVMEVQKQYWRALQGYRRLNVLLQALRRV